MTTENHTIAVIGAGNMASAIVNGCLNAPSPPVLAKHWVVVAKSDERRAQWATTGVRLVTSTSELAPLWPEITHALIAVKPQMLPEVASDASDLDFANVCSIPILAGTPISRITSIFQNATRVVRAMPNTPLHVGKGLTALCPSANATDADLASTRAIFDAAGQTLDLPENLFDAFTALAGSGPAYLFYLAEAMQTAANRAGFDDQQALAIVRQTLSGASTLLEQSDQTPAQLRAAVTSKAGTTHAATTHLDEQHVMRSITDAVLRARDRGIELAQG